MGRDVGSDEGREQAEWRDLVARLELQAPIDPAEAPWPDRENLRTATQPDAAGSMGDSGPSGKALDSVGRRPGDAKPGNAKPGSAKPGDESAKGGAGIDAGHDHFDDADAGNSGRPSADRSRVIRPAGFSRFGGLAESDATGMQASPAAPDTDEPAAGGAAGMGEPTPGGPRDYELDEPSDDDLDGEWDDRYVPPALPPQPGLDPVAKGAWLALFGGPGYLLIATLLNWQIAGWAALTAVIAFVTGFVVLVFRLGDGPSKRDGPDQGAVV